MVCFLASPKSSYTSGVVMLSGDVSPHFLHLRIMGSHPSEVVEPNTNRSPSTCGPVSVGGDSRAHRG